MDHLFKKKGLKSQRSRKVVAYTSDSHENTVGRLSESLPVDTVLLLGEGDFGESDTLLEDTVLF